MNTRAERTPSNKIDNDTIIRLNSVGISLKTISDILGIHPTTVNKRLASLKIEPINLRRAFMEDVLQRLPADTQEWLADQLSPEYNIKDYLVDIIRQQHKENT